MADSPKERLNHLVELATQGAEARVTLLGELVDLLLDWPAHYAPAMRAPFEALLDVTAREVDAPARAALAERLAKHDELPLALLNEFFLEAPMQTRVRILERNAVPDTDMDEHPRPVDGSGLVDAARNTMNGAFADIFASTLELPRGTAEEILRDSSGQSLAVACKGAGLDRAAFSTIALLTAKGADAVDRLACYDQVPQTAAESLTRFWRARG